jgi:hypothetical protein
MSCSPAKPYNPQSFQRAQQRPCHFQQSGVRLVIQDPNVQCYWLDGGYFRPQDNCLCPTSSGTGAKRCDGVIVGCWQEVCYVIFFDLKSGKGETAMSQIEDTMCYFCPCHQEGERHHNAWPVQDN